MCRAELTDFSRQATKPLQDFAYVTRHRETAVATYHMMFLHVDTVISLSNHFVSNGLICIDDT
jgi:hypothetical protein